MTRSPENSHLSCAQTAQPALSFENVCHRYVTKNRESVLAVTDVDLKIQPGEFVSVVGPSGCGKSTLLRIAGGLMQPSEGVVSFFGEPISQPRRDVSIVFQDAVMLPWLNILQNVTLPVKLAGGDMSKAKHKAMELLKRVGLAGFALQAPKNLSGGMRQRAGIVRALMNEPKALLMDEPFGALDALTREQMNFDLAHIAEYSGCSVLLITHGISEAVLLGDRVVVMSARPGCIAEIIPIDLPRPRGRETLVMPRFAELCDQVRKHFRHDSNEMAFNHD
jgi:NitT/TauT family transport system ATP-binding protein